MEPLCPQCLGQLTITDKEARCTLHGGTYQVYFRRPAPKPVVSLVEPSPNASPELSPLPPALPAAKYAGMRCVQHPNVEATAQCTSCGAYMCATCDFALPGGIHVCPSCAVSSQEKLSSRRKTSLVWSFILAGWTTLGLIAIFGGAFARFIKTKEDIQAIGVAFSVFILIPSIVGFGLGLGAIDRRLRNPPALWVAMVWNGLVLAIFLLLCVIGSFKK